MRMTILELRPLIRFLTGFSPRKRALSVYIMDGYSDYADLLARLGKHKTAVSCLYITNLDNIDMAVLEDLIGRSMAAMRRIYGEVSPDGGQSSAGTR